MMFLRFKNSSQIKIIEHKQEWQKPSLYVFERNGVLKRSFPNPINGCKSEGGTGKKPLSQEQLLSQKDGNKLIKRDTVNKLKMEMKSLVVYLCKLNTLTDA